MSTIAINDLANAGDAIDYLVGRGIKASEAVEFVARVANLHKKPKAPKLPKLPSAPQQVATTWPASFTLTDGLISYATARGFDRAAVQAFWDGFRDHHQSRGTEFVKWDAAWRTWINKRVQWRDEKVAQRLPQSGHMDGRL